MKRISIACLLVSLALIAVPAQAGAAYYPFGPQAFVDMSQLDGWQLCFSDVYGDTTDPSLDGILAQCSGDPLLLAGGPTGSATLTVLATAPRADVLFDIGRDVPPNGNTPHNANGSGWYFNADSSWGFAKQLDPIDRDSCDVEASSVEPGPNPDLRLCWHTVTGTLDGGFRAGATDFLNSSPDYTRYIYQPVPGLNLFTFALNGSRLLVHVRTGGTVSVSDAAAPLSASVAKKKGRLLLKPSSAGGPPPTITVPLKLTKTGKSKLREKGKLKVNARITFASFGFGASTQTAKLKIKGKTGKR